MKTRYQKERESILRYHKKCREQRKMFLELAGLIEQGKISDGDALKRMVEIKGHNCL